jgi:hyperosmotically inducible protein
MNKRARFPDLTMAMVVSMVLAGCGKSPVTAFDPAAASAPEANVSDLDVTGRVKQALQQDELLKGFDIQVVTTKGDVKLTGVVRSQAQADEAIKLARTADGVHAIHDEIVVKP